MSQFFFRVPSLHRDYYYEHICKVTNLLCRFPDAPGASQGSQQPSQQGSNAFNNDDADDLYR